MTVKRIFDVILVLIASPIWVPLICIVAIMVRFKLGKPVFFLSYRPGLKAQLFRLIKFRSMTEISVTDIHSISDNERITDFGRFLRSTSLDELPSLLNVLKGDLSLVGPRPLLTQYLSRYSPAQARRHEVRPGITGWSQLKVRNEATWEEKLALDVWYVDHNGFWTDLRILLLTLVKVIRREGINAIGSATMPEFMGIQSTNDHRDND